MPVLSELDFNSNDHTVPQGSDPVITNYFTNYFTVQFSAATIRGQCLIKDGNYYIEQLLATQ